MADVTSAVIAAVDLLYTGVKDLYTVVKDLKSSDIGDYEGDIEMLALSIQMTKDKLYNIDEQQFNYTQKAACDKIRVAVLDAEDLLDRVESLIKKKKLNQGNDSDTSQTSIIAPFISEFANKGIDLVSNYWNKADDVKIAIKEINLKLDATQKYLQTFGLQEHSHRELTRSMSARASGSQVNAITIMGRDGDKRQVIELLLKPSMVKRSRIPVVAIVGMGGMGKTTLVQLVFDDEIWQQGCNFDLRLWVSDSKKMDLKSVLKSILKCISPENSGNFDKLEETQLKDELVKKIIGKRFLLVLDDVENEKRLRWTNLEDLLSKGNKEWSRVLVTTRSRRVADSMGASDSTHEVKGLSEEDSLQLFESFAFDETTDENLVPIGKHIVEKCAGMPLAIKVIGSLLHKNTNRSKWERMVSDLGKDKQIMSILKMSYDDLDSKLKECFSYCALFPKNYRISKGILSSIWKANLRFKKDEDVCNENLVILYNRCFLEVAENCDDDDDTYYKMHDLMHDLAKTVAGTEMLGDFDAMVDSEKLIIDENVRHLSLLSREVRNCTQLSCELKGRRLRTFIPYSGQPRTFDFAKMVLDCPVIRFLDLHGYSIGNLTDSIGKLIHLRYLNLSSTDVQTLNSVTELINLRHLNLGSCVALTHLPYGVGGLSSLEVLDISWCVKLEELPMEVEKLTNLMHLNLGRCEALTHLPSGVGGLTSLEVLNISYCVKLEELPMEVEKLTNLVHLNLGRCEALVHLPSGVGGLTSLEVLDISWCVKLEELPMEVEKLTNLRHLNLETCVSLTHLPSGVGGLKSLEVLDISNCVNLKELPMGIEKLNNLHDLKFEGCRGLTKMPSGMGTLLPICSPPRFIVGHSKSKYHAQLEELYYISELIKGELQIELHVNIILKVSARDGEAFLLNKKWLRKLEINWREEEVNHMHNPEEEVPGNHMEDHLIMVKLQPPLTLEEFKLDGYQGTEFRSWMLKDNFASALPNVQRICISNCNTCRHLPPLSRLPLLKCLELHSLSSLEYIEEDVSSASFCPSLEALTLWNLPELKDWCRQGLTNGTVIEQQQSVMLPSFPHLVHLHIHRCPKLMVLPILVSFVKVFSVNRQVKKESSEKREEAMWPMSSSTAPALSSFSVCLFDEICRDGGSFKLCIDEGRNHEIHLQISGWVASSFPPPNMGETFHHSGEVEEEEERIKSNSLQTLKIDTSTVAELTWQGLRSLEKLTLSYLPNMERLPEGIEFLTSLQELFISDSHKLTVPEWVYTTFKHENRYWVDEYRRVNTS